MSPSVQGPRSGLSWWDIGRLGLVQTALGSIIVLATSTMNRVMVVELHLPALVPGMLVALHYVVQLARPRFGHGGDLGGRRTPWIIGGMVLMATGGIGAALSIALAQDQPPIALLLGSLAYIAIGLGVSATGTSLLALLAGTTAPERRPAAATVIWLMMIFGFVVTAIIAGTVLDPYSAFRLVLVTAGVGLAAVMITIAAVRGIEDRRLVATKATALPGGTFFETLHEVWGEVAARRLTIFIFISMLAYSAQELAFEPFAGAVLALTPGASTKLNGLLQSGALCGMIAVAVLGTGVGGAWLGSMRLWTILGCIGSSIGLAALGGIGLAGAVALVRPAVFLLGLANGLFAVAAIGAMMRLAGAGRPGREGMRMGLWGAAQAIAFALGGLFGSGLSDIARLFTDDGATAYGAVLLIEALVFVLAARQAGALFDALDHQAPAAAWTMAAGQALDDAMKPN